MGEIQEQAKVLADDMYKAVNTDKQYIMLVKSILLVARSIEKLEEAMVREREEA